MAKTLDARQLVDEHTAQIMIRHRILSASREQLAAALCALLGHPPVVTGGLFGRYNCARCGVERYDTLGAARIPDDVAVLEHALEQEPCPCTTIVANLTEEQRLLTTLARQPRKPRRPRRHGGRAIT